jgi:hypothetical protein
VPHPLTLASLVLLVAFIGGCASSYRVPGAAADFSQLGIAPEELAAQTDVPIAQRFQRKPLASFPASVAVVRLQGRGYSSYTALGHGQGDFTVVTTRDVEDRRHFERLAAMPLVRVFLPINRLVMPAHIRKETDLREAAAAVHADMLLLYTFDTQFAVDTTIPALGTLTLGMFPNRRASVTTTASAALLDTRNGFVYGLAEATARRDRVANSWFARQAVDRTRRDAEAEAFGTLIDEIETMWGHVVRNFTAPLELQTPSDGSAALRAK